MPTYDYVCRNEDCDNPSHETKFCSIELSKELPLCESCGKEMPKAFLHMPSVSWIYYNPSGQKRTSSMGPDQRAVRRHNGWHNGVKQLKPVYKGVTTKDKKEMKNG